MLCVKIIKKLNLSQQRKINTGLFLAFSNNWNQRSFHVKGEQWQPPLPKPTIKEKVNIKNKNAINKENIEYLKNAFTEGYWEGRFLSKSVNRVRPGKIILAVISGVIVGLLLPLSIRVRREESKEVDQIEVPTKFSDVMGANEAKEELKEIVDFLRNPEKFLVLGGRLPKGVLLVGPPGTGKTLLARSLAGEANVSFFHMSGSEFDNLFVGEGARRVRELFKKAKDNAPSVIFIDEIDSIGSKRSSSLLHPHSNQTINQLLSEMDGFYKNEGIIVVAATNRREDLDDALLRPGRFDVEVVVSPPNYSERKDILRYYLSRVTCEDVDIDVLARGTVGFTGADIENMINRAAIRAASFGAHIVSIDFLNSERDRIIMGPENKTRIPDLATSTITAYHEGGHCLVSILTPNSQPVHKVTIIPRGNSLGHTSFLPEQDELFVTKEQMLARIDTMMGGRAAEEIAFGPSQVTSGAASDLKAATELAYRMVSLWGMSERAGLRFGRQEDNGPAIRDIIDQEVQKILKDSYDRAKAILKKHSKEHNLLAEALLKYETLDFNQVLNVIKIKNK